MTISTTVDRKLIYGNRALHSNGMNYQVHYPAVQICSPRDLALGIRPAGRPRVTAGIAARGFSSLQRGNIWLLNQVKMRKNAKCNQQ